jgi:mannose-1-phosphate guanylyltransferase
MKVIDKPWGEEVWFAETDKYVGKMIYVKKGHRLSKQYHKVKDETLLAVQGKFLLEYDGKELVMDIGNSLRVCPNQIHRISAPFEDIVIVEVSTPEVDDVVRLEDDYGRMASGPVPS